MSAEDKFPERLPVRMETYIPEGANDDGLLLDAMNSGVEPGIAS